MTPPLPPDAGTWDQRYRDNERVWSGNPNVALEAEMADAAPGRALDVGCGEGADAVWLARRGWEVTAVEVSQVALHRARAAADRAGVHVTWVHAGLVEAHLPAGVFDLVSAFYPTLLRTPERRGETALLDAVAPGGTLLMVHHAHFDRERARAHGCDPDLYLSVDDVAGRLGEGWTVTVHEQRPRHVATGAGVGHSDDIVLRAARDR